MKRLILTLAAVTALAASPLAADFAIAKDKGGRGEDGRGRGQGRGPGQYRGDDGPRWERRGPPEGRGYDRRRGYDGPPPGAYRAPRPGGRIPPEYRGPPVADYPRYRLRPPPAGYAWRRMGDAFVLTDREGRIFDVIPD
ncbi:RcnB family protein [Phenylobacterium sp.]|uniref:RcnB family protein n=1 Tax=Phenylobacterium sp. TaxID=1871053 RepID=UPI0028119E46|nr:RcnB family protein [Phenylobacterium sp.]